MYYFIVRYFDKKLYVATFLDDRIFNLEVPTFIKSRLIDVENNTYDVPVVHVRMDADIF